MGSDRTDPSDINTEAQLRSILYVHLANDGGIFTIDGQSGRSRWVTEEHLRAELVRLSATSGQILYSRDRPDRDPPDYVERTFRLMAAAGLSIDIVEPHPLVLEHASADWSTLMAAAYGGNAAVVTDLLRRGIPVDARDSSGYTALMYAANAGQRDVAAILIQGGADANALDNVGHSPLMFAAQHGHDHLVELLLDARADPTLQGEDGLSAADLARSNRHETTADVLRKAPRNT